MRIFSSPIDVSILRFFDSLQMNKEPELNVISTGITRYWNCILDKSHWSINEIALIWKSLKITLSDYVISCFVLYSTTTAIRVTEAYTGYGKLASYISPQSFNSLRFVRITQCKERRNIKCKLNNDKSQIKKLHVKASIFDIA